MSRSTEPPAPPPAHAAALRGAHLQRESLVRSIGTVYFISSGLALVGAAVVLARHALLPGNVDEELPAGLLVFLGALATALIVVGNGVRHLAPWVRIPVAVLSAVGLLAIPVGTLIHGFVLWLVLSEKGRTVLSPAYANAVAATPTMTVPRSPLPAIFVALLAGLMLFALVAPAVIGGATTSNP